MLLLLPSQLFALAPVPLLIGGLRYGGDVGRQASGVGFAAVVTVTTLLGAGGGAVPGIAGHGLFLAGLGYLGLAALPAWLLGWSVGHTRDGAGALTLAAVGYLAVLVAAAGVVQVLSPGGLAGFADRVVVGLHDGYRAVMVRASGDDATALMVASAMDGARETNRRLFGSLFPGVVSAVAILWLWLNLVYSRWFVARRGEDDDLTVWRLPDGALYLLIGCMAGVVLQVDPIGGLFPPMRPLLLGAANGLVLLAALYWLQGVATLNFHFLRAPLGPITRMVGLAAQVVLLMTGTTVLFVLLGLADAWFDLRRRSFGQSEE